MVSLDYNWDPIPSGFRCTLQEQCSTNQAGFIKRGLISIWLILNIWLTLKELIAPSGLWVALANAGNEIESKALKARHRDYTDCFYAISEWKQATSLEHIVDGIKEIFERRGRTPALHSA